MAEALSSIVAPEVKVDKKVDQTNRVWSNCDQGHWIHADALSMKLIYHNMLVLHGFIRHSENNANQKQNQNDRQTMSVLPSFQIFLPRPCLGCSGWTCPAPGGLSPCNFKCWQLGEEQPGDHLHGNPFINASAENPSSLAFDMEWKVPIRAQYRGRAWSILVQWLTSSTAIYNVWIEISPKTCLEDRARL